MQFLDELGLRALLDQIKKIFGRKATLDENMNIRKQYLLEIDYEKTLKFNTDWIVGDNAPYVGSAVVGQTYVA